MIQEAIAKAVQGRNLSPEEMTGAMGQVMTGGATQAQIGAFLVALRMKGETVDEIAAAARVMRREAAVVSCRAAGKAPLVDTCGTGGDGSGTFNVSTTVAFVVAGAGVTVAKHGNRAMSSNSGSADLMEALGVNLSISPEQVGQCMDEVGIGFLFAPALHKAMRHAIGPRRELGMRTIFNVLGPLTNPAGADAQVLGVYDPSLTKPLAEVLAKLGVKNAYVVHGDGGYDEITITGATMMARLRGGKVEETMLRPEDLGLKRAKPEEITAAGAAESMAMCRGVLGGRPGPCRDMVLMNAAAALVAAEAAVDLAAGMALAAESIDSGAAMGKVMDLVRVSARLAGQNGEAAA